MVSKILNWYFSQKALQFPKADSRCFYRGGGSDGRSIHIGEQGHICAFFDPGAVSFVFCILRQGQYRRISQIHGGIPCS